MVASRRQNGKAAEDGVDGVRDKLRSVQQRIKRRRSKDEPSTSKNSNKGQYNDQDAVTLRRNPRRNCNTQSVPTATDNESIPEVSAARETKKRKRDASTQRTGTEVEENKVTGAKSSKVKVQKQQKAIEDEQVVVVDLDDPNKYWTPPDYSKPKQVLARELLRCQLCFKTYSDFRLSLKCLQGHGSGTMNILRCYLCYKIFTETDSLLTHFEEDHTPGSRVNTVICPFCPDKPSVPYRSVSCHVCSMHIKDIKPKTTDKAPVGASQDACKVSARLHFHQLSSINPNRFPRCSC